MRKDEMGASHPTRVHCWELACRDQKGIRSTIPLEFRQLKQRRETWWEWLLAQSQALKAASGAGKKGIIRAPSSCQRVSWHNEDAEAQPGRRRMTANEYKGWRIEIEPKEEGPGRWRIAGTLKLVADQYELVRPLNDERMFSTQREASVAGIAVARTWIDDRIKHHPLAGREASARLLSLQWKTHLLLDALRHLRQESETELQRRQQRGEPLTEPPYDLAKLVRYMRVLEDGLHKAMEDVGAYHAGGEGGVFDEAWLRKMEERSRERGE
jgi:hypothetical protein